MSLIVASGSSDWRASLLSNFAHTPFLLRLGTCAVVCASVEGFWQGLKWPEGSTERTRAFALWGPAAKASGRNAPTSAVASLCGRSVRRGSPEHYELAELALRAKIEQNEAARKALLATAGLELLHGVVGPSGQRQRDSKTLPASVFCEILTSLRNELVASGRKEAPGSDDGDRGDPHD